MRAVSGMGKFFTQLIVCLNYLCIRTVRAFDTYAEATKAAAKKLQDVSIESRNEATRFEGFMLVKFLKSLYSDIQAVIYGFEQIYKTAQIFLENYAHMESTNTKFADKYFHTKASAQAAQLGKFGEQTAKFVGDTRELVDSYKNVYLKGMTLNASIKDSTEDLKANELGRRLGRQNPISEMKDFIDRSRLPGVDDEY